MMAFKHLLLYVFFIHTINLNDISIDPEIIVNDIDDKSVKFKDVVKKNQLFYRIKNIYCKPCVDRELRLLGKLSQSLPANSIVVLSSYANFRSFLSFSRSGPKGISFYNVQSLGGSLDNQKEEGSYYFNLDSEYKLYNLQFSDKQSPKKSAAYLDKFLKSVSKVKSNGS